MDALLAAMSPECKALIIGSTEAPIAKVCKPLNHAFRKGMQKIRDRQFRTLEAAYSGHSHLDYFKADNGIVELTPLKPNVMILVFLYILDDYGYVVDADLKFFGDEASNSACEINEDQTRNDDRTRSKYGDSGHSLTAPKLFPRSRPADRDFNQIIWGSPGLPADISPPKKLKSKPPVS